MIKHSVKILSCITFSLLSLHAFAENTITVNVKAEAAEVAAIGYTVEGKNSGRIGSSYTGKGPKNKEYVFGYRKGAIYGKNIRCGTLTLSENSTVTLVHQDGACRVVVVH